MRTLTNRSGGVQGGISNGEDIVIRVAFKPTSTIGIKQQTVTREGVETELRARGRHDPCVVPRAVPMVESRVAIVLADQLLQVCEDGVDFIIDQRLNHFLTSHSTLDNARFCQETNLSTLMRKLRPSSR